MSGPVIRFAKIEDAKDLLAIYEPYILETAITFENEPVPLEVFQKRMETIQNKFPWLIYERDGEILGYAYCSQFKERAAYAWDSECSVYIAAKAHRQGIGSALYERLFEIMKQLGYYNIYALISYHQKSSIALHQRFGFREVGIYHNTGYKMDKWWDVCVMEKNLRSFDQPTGVPMTIHELINRNT